jgi:hypothetical protein
LPSGEFAIRLHPSLQSCHNHWNRPTGDIRRVNNQAGAKTLSSRNCLFRSVATKGPFRSVLLESRTTFKLSVEIVSKHGATSSDSANHEKFVVEKAKDHFRLGIISEISSQAYRDLDRIPSWTVSRRNILVTQQLYPFSWAWHDDHISSRIQQNTHRFIMSNCNKLKNREG